MSISGNSLPFYVSENSPLCNQALIILNWEKARPELKQGEKSFTQGKKFRYGYRYRLEGIDFIIWLQLESTSPRVVHLILGISNQGKNARIIF